MSRPLLDCDGHGSPQADVQAVGHDANGDPDAPDLCWLCRQQWKRGKVWDREAGRYVRPEERP